MSYIEVNIPLTSELSEIIIAELSSIGYDSFMETDEGIMAYVEESLFNENELKEVLQKYIEQLPAYSFGKMEEKNWNEEWEKNFEPVFVEDQVVVRASFHQVDPKIPYNIVINPKMSFGTGHHETTFMMIQNQLEIDHKGKKVMDVGSGTGILAVFASMCGAKHVFAFDIEDWAFENLKENCNLNDCNNIITAKGTMETVSIPFPVYDIILANINRNVLLADVPKYSKYLQKGGILVVSGFYEEDIKDIEAVCISSSLKTVSRKTRNKWASMVLEKI